MQLTFLIILTTIMQSVFCIRPLEPVHNGEVDVERLEVLQEIFMACFQPATVKGRGVWEIRFLELHMGYISRVGVNYVFSTLDLGTKIMSDKYKPKLEAAVRRKAPEKGLYRLPIKAKMSSKLLTQLINIPHQQPMKVVETIENHTGAVLQKTRDYLNKYQ
ncbi:MAG: hypothetical protein EOP45_17015 [Sphingobacteriaceae bacterium]|nr:MAG: hypothetical protein EOP45_17015 [Sphingobacteriaceae bacterium]